MCWGYEKDCSEDKRLFVPRCDEPPKPWAQSMEGKMDLFWTQGDFGYIKKEVDSLTHVCSPNSKEEISTQIAKVGALVNLFSNL